jgi:DNA invertase Pin-like site-specific DNA recombinase
MTVQIVRMTAAYLRVSSDKQSVDRQRAGIIAYAARLGIEIDVWYIDDEGVNSRDLAWKRKKFQKMMEAVEAGEISQIIVDKQDRFGTADSAEMGYYITILRRNDCVLWDIEGRDITQQGLVPSVVTAIGAATSQAEQKEKAHRSVDGKRSLAARGEFQGGYPPYGFDIGCYGPDGVEKWRTVYYGHFTRIKLYPDGRKEEFNGKNNAPKKDAQDIRKLVPSVEKQRVEMAAKCFEWAAEETISPGAIARRLNELNVPCIFQSVWAKHAVKAMLRNPVYMGYMVWNRIGKGRHREFTGGVEQDVPMVKGRAVNNRKRDRSDWIKGAKPDFEAIVPKSRWELVQAKLDASSSKHTQPKRHTNVAGLWLRPFMYCGRCNLPMHGHGGNAKTRIDASYFDGAYNTLGKDNPYGCKCHRVTHRKIEALVRSYLEDVAPKVNELLDAADRQDPAVLEPLLTGIVEAHVAVMGAESQMAHSLASHFEARSYDQVMTIMRPAIEAEIADLEQQHADAYADFRALKAGLAKSKVTEEMARLEGRITSLKVQLTDLDEPLAKAKEELTKRKAAFDKALSVVSGEATGRRKAAAVEQVISRITCFFDYTGKAGRSTLNRLEITPVVGDVTPIQAASSAQGDAVCFIPGDSILRVFVYEALRITLSADDIGRIAPLTGTSRKSYKLKDLERQREIGRKAAAARWAKARASGQPDSRTPEQRSEAGRKAMLGLSAKKRQSMAKKAAAASPATKKGYRKSSRTD